MEERMDVEYQALRLLLEQQSKHGDATYSKKASSLLTELMEKYGDLDALSAQAGLTDQPLPSRSRVPSSFDQREGTVDPTAPPLATSPVPSPPPAAEPVVPAPGYVPTAVSSTTSTYGEPLDEAPLV